MAENTNGRITRMLLSKSRRAQYVRVFAVLAVCVVAAVVIALHQSGVAMTHEERILTCPITDVVAHTHNTDCYDEDGNLVCTLPELELHTHTDDCYDENGELICGKEEVTQEHVHGPGCFTTVTVNNDDEIISIDDQSSDANSDDAITIIDEQSSDLDVIEIDGEEGDETDDAMPAQSFTGKLKDKNDKVILKVDVEAPAGAFPAGTTMEVTRVKSSKVADVVSETISEAGDNRDVDSMQAVDIVFRNAEGDEIEPLGPITVSMTSDKIADESAKPVLVHVDDEGKGEVVDQLSKKQAAKRNIETGDDTLAFDADAFSIYVIAYTVDFHYSANGKTYDFSIPGGGYVTLQQLVEVLGIADGATASEEAQNETALTLDDVVISDKTKEFVANIEKVEFSNPELVWVGKVDDNSTVGELKEANELDSQYSSELTKKQIAKVNKNAVESGDWALISILPFTSNESLTVTMKNGDTFTISVTDDQIVSYYLSDKGELYEVTVTYGVDAQIPKGATLKITEFDNGTEEYNNAKKAVIADKLSRDDTDDIDTFNLAALDISIIDSKGNEIEPKAPVQVDLKIKELPGVQNLKEVTDTLAVQHHVETGDGVVVETVYEGGNDASFRMDTDENVATLGNAVQPDSVDLSQYGVSTFELLEDGSIAPVEKQSKEDSDLDVSFDAGVFSTFTITWGTNNQISSVSNGKYIIYGKDAANGKYYALVPGRNLKTVEVTLSKGLVQYSGNENLYWDVKINTYGNDTYYEFTFTENWQKYYLVAGNNSDKVKVSTTNGNYGNSSTAKWGQWNNLIHSAQDTFLQSYNGTFRVRNINTGNNTLESNWEKNSQIYFEVQGQQEQPSATIHYVDEGGNELSVSAGSISSDTLLNDIAYLIYDIEGGKYEYKETYLRRNSNNTTIRAYLKWDNDKWKYTTNGTGWNDIKKNDNIYVVYKKKATPPEGGTPTLVELTEQSKPDAPTVKKDSTVNGDGTNTISLSVTSHTKPREVLKLADVVVILDRSGSMKKEIDSDSDTETSSKQRMTHLKTAVNDLADALIGNNTEYIYTDARGVKHKQIRMSLVSFSNEATAASDFTDDASKFKGYVNALKPDGGTNWEQALQKANEAAVDSGRATFVIFVTDGEPTFRMTRMTETDSSLYGDFSDDAYYHNYNVYGQGNSDVYGKNYAAALVQAQSIVNLRKNLYMIGIGPKVNNLKQFNTDANGSGYYSVSSSGDLTNAFEDIKKKIAALAGYSDFQISDGITALTQTVEKSTLVNYADDNFTYYKGHAATQKEVTEGKAAKVADMIWEGWSPASEGCAEASYKNGAVVWNMGSGFMPSEGYTYQVRFKVWPSQDAYDLLADLNNGVKSYANLSPEEKAQIKEPTTVGGMYTLKTNSDTSYNYKEATVVDGRVTTSEDNVLTPNGEFGEVDPLELTTKPLKIKKQWQNNYVDSRVLPENITMELYGVDPNGTTSKGFKEITLTAVDNWYSDNNFISFGLVTFNKNYKDVRIYETGHDFTVRETDDEAHHYELVAGTYRAMNLNGTPTILELMDKAPNGMAANAFHYSDGTHQYYRLDGKVYRATQSDALLTATNSHRSFMDLKKVVLDKDKNAVSVDDEFEYQITFTVPNGIYNYDSVEKYIWFSVYDSVAKRTLSPEEYTYTGAQRPADLGTAYSGSEFANYLVATSGEQLTLKIKTGWNVRFLNLPIGTTYSFEEVNVPEGYDFVNAEVTGTRWISNMENGVDAGSAVDMTGLPKNDGKTADNTSITGTIDYANAQYKTTYQNRSYAQTVRVLKVEDGNQPLAGAALELKKRNDDGGFEILSSFTSTTEAKTFSLYPGIYSLTETKAPVGYIFTDDETFFQVEEGNNGAVRLVKWSETERKYVAADAEDYPDASIEDGTVTITIINRPGAALPNTGGIGTRLFTVLGSILVAGASFLLVMQRRRTTA